MVHEPSHDPTSLPSTVYALAENKPVEDVLLAVLRYGLPDVPWVSLVADDPPAYFGLVRRVPGVQYWRGDTRFVDVGRFVIQTFTRDPDGDQKGADLSEAVRVVLRTAWLERWNFPGIGEVVRIDMLHEPARRADWQTSVGPIQYADLPTGYFRYEATYSIRVRTPRS